MALRTAEPAEFRELETGRRHPPGAVGWLLSAILLAWALFQLWYASPLPYALGIGVFNDGEARAIHLAFALLLAFAAFPARLRSPVERIPWPDVLFALASASASLYLIIFHTELANRAGNPTPADITVALIGLILLLEAARRTLGFPLVIVALVFLVYTFGGPYMPDVIAHKGAGVQKVMAHQWLSSEGVFGIALGVSTAFVFLFVMFGALLEKAGAGQWFIQLAFSLLGHYRGGPAKAAVVASALTGMVSGSSIANVVTTGTFTIPLMKRVGFPAVKAGAVEAAASTNGQLMPPVMGAAAFLMVEFVGISYLEVIKHALLPAIICYIALLYIVHLEAVKAGMHGLPREHRHRWPLRLAIGLGSFIALCLLTLAIYFGVNGLKTWLGDGAIGAIIALLLFSYLGLAAWAAPLRVPGELSDAELDRIPPFFATLRSGSYFLLPVAVLVWCLAVERLSPGLSAFWAVLFMLMIVLTHRALRRCFMRQAWRSECMRGARDVLTGLIAGSRNMIGIGIATAAAGIVVGTVTLTGIGLVMTEFVEFISGGNLLFALIFTALICLLLGLGLPTTANYIVVATLMAPVIVSIGAEHGLIVPLIAVHMFVFYFGIMADDTPPVGLAAFAAAAIARSDPVHTGVQGFIYDSRTAILPFMFIFNTQLLLIGIDSIGHLALTILGAVVAMLCFAAATQGWWLTRSRWWETLALLLIAFSLFRPGFWWDQLYPPLDLKSVTTLQDVRAALRDQERISFDASGLTLEGKEERRRISLRLPESADDDLARLERTGLYLYQTADGVLVERVDFGSAAEKAGLDFDWRLEHLVVEADRPSPYWLYPPILAALGLLALSQQRRIRTTVTDCPD